MKQNCGNCTALPTSSLPTHCAPKKEGLVLISYYMYLNALHDLMCVIYMYIVIVHMTLIVVLESGDTCTCLYMYKSKIIFSKILRD